MVVSVGKMSLWELGFIFIFYIICHIGVALFKKKFDKDILTKADNKETQLWSKIFNFLYKWFPAIYLIGVVLMFYAVQ